VSPLFTPIELRPRVNATLAGARGYVNGGLGRRRGAFGGDDHRVTHFQKCARGGRGRAAER